MVVRLFPMIGIILAALLSLHVDDVAAARSGAAIEVGKKVVVTPEDPDWHQSENLIAVAPDDPRRLIVCAKQFHAQWHRWSPERVRVTAYVSSDGGRNWRATLTSPGTDPACAFGYEGAVYFSSFAITGPRVLDFYRSSDGGQTWAERLALPAVDREYLVVDTTGGPGDGRLYLHAAMMGGYDQKERGEVQSPLQSVDPTAFFASSDGGKSFAGPILKFQWPPRKPVNTGNSVVLSDGALVAVVRILDEEGDSSLRLLRSPSALEDWSKKGQRVLSVDARKRVKKESWSAFHIAEGRMRMIPIIAVDPGSARFKDRLYVVWADEKSIWIALSMDRGESWSQPVVLGRTASGDELGYRAVPRVAVNRDGIVGVAWYEQRGDDQQAGREMFRASLDGGVTWTAPVVLSSNAANYHKDTAGLAASIDGRFHVVWGERNQRYGTVQLFTAAISVAGEVTLPAGAGEDVNRAVPRYLRRGTSERGSMLRSEGASCGVKAHARRRRLACELVESSVR